MTSNARRSLLLIAAALLLPSIPTARADPAAVDAGPSVAPPPDGTPVRARKRRHHHHANLHHANLHLPGSSGGTDEPGDAAARPAARADRGDGEAAVKGAATAAAGRPTVLGDSIGIGLSMASGAPRLAHEGVAIRSSAALAQLHRVADRSVVVLSLGTNDAVGSIKGVEGAIDRIRAVAERNELRVVWLGPPCVFKSWNDTAGRLDAVLKQRLSDDGRIRYVSAADPQVCDRSLRAGDGVHFTMKGYAMLWKRVVAAEGEWASRPARKVADGAAVPARARTASNDRPTAEGDAPR